MRRARRTLSTLVLCAGVWLALAAGAQAAGLQQVGTYTAPVFVTSDPQDADRIFVVEQGGGANPPRIRLTSNGQTTTFLDAGLLSSPGVAAGGEQGLLSMAFAADFATSGRFWVFYTGTDGGALHVDEFTAAGDSVDVATRRAVITIPHPGAANHNGGQLQLGPDGYLYISTGDGGGGGDPGENAQDLDSLLGKLLRIAPTPGGGYSSPADNPFFGPTAGADEIWSFGLRNPWRFSFDRITGDLFVGDVGQASWEEVDFDPVGLGAGRGDNFGWDCYEGRHEFELAGCPPIADTTQPVLEYPNPNGSAAPPSAVAGGYLVRDPTVCELYGRYVYADTYAGIVRSFVPGLPDATGDRSEGLSAPITTSFGEDAAGRVYVASGNGPVYRLIHTPGAPCPATVQAPPPADAAPPGLTLDAKRRQSVSDRKLSLIATTGRSATVTVDATVTGRSGLELFDLVPESAEAVSQTGRRLRWTLRRRQARLVKRLLRRGRHVEVVFAGVASDEGSNPSVARIEVRLKLR